MKFLRHPLLDKINIAKHVCKHVLGEKHTKGHRVTAGTIIIILGTVITHLPIDMYAAYLICASLGHILQGIGALPILHLVEETH